MHNQGSLRFATALWAATTLLFMAAMSIGLAVFGLVALYFLVRERGKWTAIRPELFQRNAFFWASIAIIVVAILSLIVAYIDPPLGILPHKFSEIKKFQYFAYPFVLAAALYQLQALESGFLRVLAKVFLGVGLLASLAGIIQFWGVDLFPKSLWQNNTFFRPMTNFTELTPHHFHSQGFMQFHLSFATAMFFPLSLAAAQLLWGEYSGRARMILAALVFIFGLAIFYTYSRAAWGALLVWVPLAVILWRPKAFFLMLPLLLGVVFVTWTFVPSVRERAQDPMGVDGRKIVWKVSWEMFRERPLTGVGFSKTGEYSDHYAKKLFGEEQWFSSHAHNNFLDALASTGILGFLAFIAWWAVLFIYAWRAFRSQFVDFRVWGGAFLLAAVAFHVNGMTQVNFYDAKSQHGLIFWTGIILYFEVRRRAGKLPGRAPATT